MSQEIDRLIESAFEHDRERVTKSAARTPSAASVPQDLLQKASMPATSATVGVFAAAWFKVTLAIIAIGGIATYFALQNNQAPTSVGTPAPQTGAEPIIDSPIVQQNVTRQTDSTATSRPRLTKPGPQPTTLPSPAPHLMPPILDSGVKIRDSIRALHRAK